jgi:hypothetical protein
MVKPLTLTLHATGRFTSGLWGTLERMILLGIVLLVVGLFFSSLLFWIGVVLIILGIVFNVTGLGGPRSGGGRRYWY